MSTPKAPAKKSVAKKAARKRAPGARAGYTAVLQFYGKPYTGKGKTVTEAIANIALKNAAKGRGILTISKGKKSKDRILQPVVVQRLFSMSPTMREVQIKHVSMLFDL